MESSSDIWMLLVFIIVELIAFFLSVVGNILVCYVVMSKKRLAKTSNQYILSVSAADFLVGIFTVPFGILRAIDNIPHEPYLCLYLSSFGIVAYCASLTSLLAVSVDRFWAICFPISYRKAHWSTKLMIIVSWILPCVVGSLPLFDKQYQERFKNKCIVTTVVNKHVLFFYGGYICLGCIIMIILYCFIYRKVSRQQKARLQRTVTGLVDLNHDLNKDLEKINRIRKAEIRVAKTFAIVIGVYVICWTPMTVNFLIVGVTEDVEYFQNSKVLRIFHVLSIWAAHINSGINPFIYAYRIKDIRDSIKDMPKTILQAFIKKHLEHFQKTPNQWSS